MLTKTQLNTKIRGVTTSAGTLRDNVQTVLVNACGHAYRHNDTSYFNTLYKGITGVNVAKLEKYATKHLGVQFDRDTETFKLHKKAVHDFRELHGASGEKMGKTSLPTDDEADKFVVFLEDTLPVWYAQSEQSGEVKPAKPLLPPKIIGDAAKRVAKAYTEGKVASEGWTLAELEVAQSAINNAVALLKGQAASDGQEANTDSRNSDHDMKDVTPDAASAWASTQMMQIIQA